jgi:hypothetical protein
METTDISDIGSPQKKRMYSEDEMKVMLERARLEGQQSLYTRLESACRRVKITHNGKWVELDDYMAGVRIALEHLSVGIRMWKISPNQGSAFRL